MLKYSLWCFCQKKLFHLYWNYYNDDRFIISWSTHCFIGKVLIILPMCSLDHYRFFGILIQFPIKKNLLSMQISLNNTKLNKVRWISPPPHTNVGLFRAFNMLMWVVNPQGDTLLRICQQYVLQQFWDTVLRENCVWVSPVEVQVSSGLLQGRVLWVQQTWVWHKPSWRRSPLTPP